MTIKTRSALAMVGIVAAMLLLFSAVMYFSLVRFEQHQFRERLLQKARNTVTLLEEVQEIDSQLLQIIDANTVQELRKEKILILGSQNQVLYSSPDEHQIGYQAAQLQRIRQEGSLHFDDGQYDAVGIRYDYQGRQRIVLVSAFDESRGPAIRVMLQVLLTGNVLILLAISAAAYLLAGRVLRPLAQLNEQIAQVNDATLHHVQQVAEPATADELQQLAASFNHMLQRLQQAFEQQQAFMRFASHELRTPLASITAQLDVALLQSREPAADAALLQSLQEDHDRLSALVTQLLQVFRADKPLQASDIAPLALHELVEDAMTDVAHHYPEVQWQLMFDPPPGSPEDLTVAGNASLLQSAVSNLLSNAAKYSQPTQVQVTLGYTSSQVLLTVTNPGPAMDEEAARHLFSAFYRSHHSSGRPGVGLGLLLVKKLATLHGGQVQYQYNSESGHSFCLQLPRFRQAGESSD